MAQIKLVSTHITRLEVDVIVNAANQALLGNGALDNALQGKFGYE